MTGARKFFTAMLALWAAMAATPASACNEEIAASYFQRTTELVARGNDPEYELKELIRQLDATFPICNESLRVRTLAASANALYATHTKDAAEAQKRANKAWAHYSAARMVEINAEKAGIEIKNVDYVFPLSDAHNMILYTMLGAEQAGAPRGAAFSDPVLQNCRVIDSASSIVFQWSKDNNAYSEAAHKVIDDAVTSCRPKFAKDDVTSGYPLQNHAEYYLMLASSAQDAAQRKALVAVVESDLAEYRKVNGKLHFSWTAEHQAALDKLKAM